MNSRFRNKTQWHIKFLFVSGRHVEALADASSRFPLISRIWKIAVAWILSRIFAYLINSFRIYITDTGRKLLTVLLLIFDGMVARKPAIANKKVAKTIPRIIVDSS